MKAPGITGELRLAPLTEARLEAIHACLDEVARERRWLAMVEAPPLPALRDFALPHLRAGDAQMLLLDGEQVAGWCDILPGPPRLEAMRHVGTLGMGLRAGWRGRGLGAPLLAATLLKAAQRGLTRVVLSVRADNQAAIALYERLGFVHEGRSRQGLRLDGASVDSLAMALLLDEPAAGTAATASWSTTASLSAPASPPAGAAAAATACPLCGGGNACAQADGRGQPCWCATVTMPPALLQRVPAAQRGLACVCPRCVAAALLG